MGRKWLDNYGQEDNYNDSKISLPKGFVGQGYDISGRNYSPAWKGQFQSGGNVESKWEYSNTNGKLIPQSQLKTSDWLLNNIVSNQNNNLIPIAKNGVIKDNDGYWNPNNWGKVVEIGSNDITMKGVNQPLLGISDEGDIQYMEPNKDYKFKGKKVTEYPVIQNGSSLSPKQFFQDYLSSPMYVKRLKLMEYNNPIKVQNERLNKLNKMKSTSIEGLGTKHTLENNTLNWDQKEAKEFNYLKDKNSVIAHEMSHGTGSRGYVGMSSELNGSEYLSPKEIGALYWNLKKDTDLHDSLEQEYKSDMDALRYQLKADGIYDTSKEVFKKEHLQKAKEKYKNNFNIKRFFKNSRSDDKIIWLMNNIAQNNNQEAIPIARNGINNLDENSLQQLDQLTNFTNYNKLSNGGWLDKF